jgi:hypothetical protein
MTSASASRVTRSSRSLRVAVAMFAGVLAVVTVLRAQETPPAAPATAPAEIPPGAAASGADASTEAPASGPAAAEAQEDSVATSEPSAAADTPASADRPRPVGPTPGRFEPTEKVRADFDVAFPIDI